MILKFKVSSQRTLADFKDSRAAHTLSMRTLASTSPHLTNSSLSLSLSLSLCVANVKKKTTCCVPQNLFKLSLFLSPLSLSLSKLGFLLPPHSSPSIAPLKHCFVFQCLSIPPLNTTQCQPLLPFSNAEFLIRFASQIPFPSFDAPPRRGGGCFFLRWPPAVERAPARRPPLPPSAGNGRSAISCSLRSRASLHGLPRCVPLSHFFFRFLCQFFFLFLGF